MLGKISHSHFQIQTLTPKLDQHQSVRFPSWGVNSERSDDLVSRQSALVCFRCNQSCKEPAQALVFVPQDTISTQLTLSLHLSEFADLGYIFW